MAKILRHFGRRAGLGRAGAGQMRPIPGRERAMARNAAGGFAFVLDDWARLERFLILGTEGGTYYATEAQATQDAAAVVTRTLAEDGARTVETIVRISQSGRAPRPDPAILALAMAAGSPDLATRRAALAALPKVARTGTHLFQFAEAVRRTRGWGRGLRRAVAAWYDAQPLDRLVLSAVKYRGRQVAGKGTRWTHRDLLRLAHPTARNGEVVDADRAALYRAIVARDGGGRTATVGRPALAQWDAAVGLAEAAAAEALDPRFAARVIADHRLPREAVPTSVLGDARVWEALLADMPATAMIRNLGKMTEVGLLAPKSAATQVVLDRLGDRERLAKARVHPIQLLMAHAVYAKGAGIRGRLQWRPVAPIGAALEAAFYAAFASVPASGRRLMLALDVSGSMGVGSVAGAPLTPREAATAMALVAAAQEPDVTIRAFSTDLVGTNLRAGMRLDRAIAETSRLPFGGTDCALPMRAALDERLEVDGFVVYTDNETWAGREHPMTALQRYREATGIAAKLIVVGLTATGFSIADPEDGGALDVVGFDAAAPAVMTDFLRA